MFIAFIGILLIVLSYVLKNDYRLSRFLPVAKMIGILIILAGIGSACIKQIGAGQIGVQSLFGKVNNRTLESGLNVVNPLVEVTLFNIKTQNYTMSGVQDEGDQENDDAIRALSADGLEVIFDVTVLYSVIPSAAPTILKEIGADYKNIIVRPIVRTKIRDNTVYYQAVDLYSAKRDEFQQRIFKSVESDFKRRGLSLEQLLVRNITLPASVRTTIESKINAEQDAQKMQFVLLKEKQEAERKRVEAQE